MPTAHIEVLVIVVVTITLMLLRPRDVSEVWWVGGGALVLVLTGLTPVRLALRAVGEGADVYFFLVGMMLLSKLASDAGVFDWVASVAVRKANRSPVRLFSIVYAIGTVVTIVMSNDATAVVLTPAILSAVKKARVEPLPHLFVCAVIANAASFVLPISNPANLVVFQDKLPSLGAWLSAFALPSVLSVLVTYAVLRWYFRDDLRKTIEVEVDPMPLTSAGRSVLGGLALVSVVLLAASALRIELGLPTLLASIAVTFFVSIRRKRSPLPLLAEISWATIGLVAALFVIVDTIESIGALALTRSWLASASELPPALSAFVVSGLVGVGNNVVNNLPLGLLVGATVRDAQPSALLTHALLVGVDLGPNLSITGSLATILWLLALKKEDIRVSFWQFMKVGLLTMPAALVAAVSGLVVTHWLTGH